MWLAALPLQTASPYLGGPQPHHGYQPPFPASFLCGMQPSTPYAFVHKQVFLKSTLLRLCNSSLFTEVLEFTLTILTRLGTEMALSQGSFYSICTDS